MGINRPYACKLCVAKSLFLAGRIKKKPHVGHHDQCPERRKGKPAAVAGRNMLFAGAATATEPDPTTPTTTTDTTVAAGTTIASFYDAIRHRSDIDLGLELRLELESKLKRIDLDNDVNRLLNKSSAPKPVVLLFEYISDEIKMSRRPKTSSTLTLDQSESLKRRHRYFQGSTCLFRFPKDPSAIPNPYYHSVEGTEIFALDWEAMFPDIELRCPSCGGALERCRTNWSKNKTLFPIIQPSGIPIWGSVMIYQKKNVRFYSMGMMHRYSQA
jgi:hypothetical protein